MSATIPDTMLLKDLLKATGYDCPDDLKTKTFKEATAGDVPADLEDNHAVSVNASTYTQPIEVTPAEGKEGMKKCTITLTNIPVAGATLYAFGTAEGVVYLTEVPSADTASVDVYVPAVTGLAKTTGSYTAEGSKVTVSATDYARYATGDVAL